MVSKDMSDNDYPYGKKKIRRFPTGAVRSNDAGRPDPTLISPYAMEELAMHLTENTNEFDPQNYWLGIPEEECLKSMLRHYISYQKHKMAGLSGEYETDLRAIAFNAMAALHTHALKKHGKYKEIYDRTELIDAE